MGNFLNARRGNLLLAFLFPAICFAQQMAAQVKNEMDQMQAIADTTKFPVPFEYKYIDSVRLSSGDIYMLCSKWVEDSLNRGARNYTIKSQPYKKIIIYTLVNQIGVAETLTIDIEDGLYIFDFDKARLIENKTDGLQGIDVVKDSKDLRFAKYYTSTTNIKTFQSFQKYVSKAAPQ
jgi:hypothetical protein